jgi:hypothetical protein
MSKMSFLKYEPLNQETILDGPGNEEHCNRTFQWSLARAWKVIYALPILIFFSLASNALMYLKLRNAQGQLDAQSYGTCPPWIPRRSVDLAEPW